ncbi:anaerobic ribonucleoside-triphosphate reductase [Nitrincola nitratireducens]|uniref:Anaerobic ribonucleoside-triphosphate reductase n=1 Tax=Nitrincola nitratireducens TaxID=1229521 RepID=W9UXU4_9GAMM|nr:anaerobic ribonucleoside-triphosphate reductase [Nitrincola nitratireducens]EXJ09546.1 anaerobic ribonucleoside-triphosphate reductase [Nitrincola nitratireducens]
MNTPDMKSPKHLLEAQERQPCEVWTRVMGYHRPVSHFNHGKQSEHYERKHFIEYQTFSASK